jgi:hypothetical protein
MSATKAQIKFIDDLMTLGADIPCDSEMDKPDFSMYDSIAQADAYIKKWQHLLRRVPTTKLRADEWGGIPNC